MCSTSASPVGLIRKIASLGTSAVGQVSYRYPSVPGTSAAISPSGPEGGKNWWTSANSPEREILKTSPEINVP